ncbi:glucuronyl hydrolase [Bacteroidia bacterium]|nr:glucuronyl hydrolase [Bacteroidia bacterium]
MQSKFLILLVVLFFTGCAVHHQQEDIVGTDFDFASRQLQIAVSEVEKAKQNETPDKVSPRTIESEGCLHLVPSRDWTSGFFPGTLWYMYEYTDNNQWKELAKKYTASIEPEKMNGNTHDMGFKMYCSFGNGYRLTKDQNYRDILLQSAKTLITRFKPKAGIIRSWDHNTDKWQCPVIIDNMMNLELLFWAFNETQDSVYYHIAVSHAKKTIENHFRQDYSSYHVIDYDTITGEVLKKNTHQGYAHESAWARGQAWGMYGFTMCYRETGDPVFLEQAQAITDFIFTHKNMPADLIPYWDFDAPEIPDEPRDVSAATVIASALYELSLYDTLNAGKYRQWADTILTNLSRDYLSPLGENKGFLLLHSTGSKPMNSEVDVPLSYADYYFLEALLRKQKLKSGK